MGNKGQPIKTKGLLIVTAFHHWRLNRYKQIYDEDAISPGFWPAATYEYVEQDDYENRAWVSS